LAGNDANTVLLIHSDTSDEAVAFVDSGRGANCPHTVNRVGNTHHETDQQKFGTTSMYFDGAGDSLTVADNLTDFDFAAGDFTVDFWVYPTQNIGTYHEEWVMYFNGAAKLSWITRRNTDGTLQLYLSSNGTSWDFNQATSETVSSNAWHHIAIVRDGNVIKPFIDGTLATFGTTAYANSLSTSPDLLRIGDSGPGSDVYEGYLDEIRISKGVARWTEAFTPPLFEYGHLYVNDGAHVHTADSPSIIQILAILAVNDSSHVHTADSPTLLAIFDLLVNDAVHVHTADSPLLVVYLAVLDAIHSMSADSPALSFIPAETLELIFTGKIPGIDFSATKPSIQITGKKPGVEFE